MRSNVFGLGIALGAFAVIGWAFHEHPVIARPLASVKNSAVAAGSTVKSTVSGALTSEPAAGTRKCVIAGQVTYTNQDCPAGSQSQTVGGNVTVLPAITAKPESSPPSAPQSQSQSDLREKAVERAMNR